MSTRLKALLKPNGKKTIAVPAAHTDAVIKCVGYAAKKSIADFILLGDAAKIAELAGQMQVDLSNVEIIEEQSDEEACRRAVLLAKDGKAQLLMKGLAHTAVFLRALMDKKHGLFQGAGLISQVSVFDIPGYHKLLFLTDPGINVLPTLEQKALILKNVLSVAGRLGVRKPKVACIAPVETVNNKISSTIDAHALGRMQGVFGDAVIEGPISFDIAVSKEAARIKGTNSAVAGDADILLMPEINSGNVLYKSLTTFAGASVAGVIAGLSAPVILTSRADSEENRELSIELALSLGD